MKRIGGSSDALGDRMRRSRATVGAMVRASISDVMRSAFRSGDRKNTGDDMKPVRTVERTSFWLLGFWSTISHPGVTSMNTSPA